MEKDAEPAAILTGELALTLQREESAFFIRRNRKETGEEAGERMIENDELRFVELTDVFAWSTETEVAAVASSELLRN